MGQLFLCKDATNAKQLTCTPPRYRKPKEANAAFLRQSISLRCSTTFQNMVIIKRKTEDRTTLEKKEDYHVLFGLASPKMKF
jgi:hypothetical protein